VDTLLLIAGFFFIVIGVYGAFVLPGSSRQARGGGGRTSATSVFHEAFASTQRPPERRTQPATAPMAGQEVGLFSGIFRPGQGGQRPERTLAGRGVIREVRPPAERTFSEVDLLRAQVEELRTELAALSSSPATRPERPRLRRHGIGLYTYLPPALRRQVREVRSSRRAPRGWA
jgi:hypothetical protein